MVNVLLSHEVKDFATWKTGFDSDETNRAAAGIKVHGVYTSVDNPNHVTVHTEFPSVEVVNGFLNNPELAASMEAAGVTSKPEAKILNKV